MKALQSPSDGSDAGLSKLAERGLANLRLTFQWTFEERIVHRKEAVRRLKCPFDSEKDLEAKGKNAKAKGPYDSQHTIPDQRLGSWLSGRW
jgi:hypothetical protein